MINNNTEVNSTAHNNYQTSNSHNSSLDGFFSFPPPPDFPFGGPTQAMFDLIAQLFQRFSLSKAVAEASKNLEGLTKATESTLQDVINACKIPTSVFQYFQVYPAKPPQRDLLSLGQIIDAIVEGRLQLDELTTFLGNLKDRDLTDSQQIRLFKALIKMSPCRNLKRLLEVFFEYYPNFDVNSSTQEGVCAVLCLVTKETRNVAALRVLLQRETADPNACVTNEGKETRALHSAIEIGRDCEAKLLLNHQLINVNAQDSNGNTALHLALKNNWTIAEILLRHPNINLYLRNNNNQIPADLLSLDHELLEKLDIDKSIAKFILSMSQSSIKNPAALLRVFFNLPENVKTFEEILWFVNKILMKDVQIDPRSIFQRQRTGKM